MIADAAVFPLPPEEVDKLRADVERGGDVSVKARLKLIQHGYVELPKDEPKPPSRFVENTAIGMPLQTRHYAGATTTPRPRQVPLMTCAADVLREVVYWLWPGRIPGSRISFFMGMPDQGKSTLMTYLIAIITRGACWPDCGDRAEKGSVIVLQAEESRGEDIAERLESLGADTSKVHYLDMVDMGDERRVRFTLSRNVEALEAALDLYGDVRAVIFDPFDAYLGDAGSRNAEDAYEVLIPLKDLAERRKVAIIFVGHPNKDGEKHIIHRLSGSKAFAALARVLWYISEDPNDSTRRMLSYVKGNPKGLNRKPLAWSLTPDGELLFDLDAGDMQAKHVDFLLQRNLKTEALRARKRGPQPSTSKDAATAVMELLDRGALSRAKLKQKIVSGEISESSFAKALKALVADGKVVRLPLGQGRKGLLIIRADKFDGISGSLPLADPHTPPETAREGLTSS